MSNAFFVRDGDRYLPTELTRGPWSPDAQHGGPPAALLGTALERTEPRADSVVVRASFEMLKPVPLAPLTIATRMANGGRSVQTVAGVLSAGGEEVMRGQVMRIRTADLPIQDSALPERPPGPDRGRAVPFFPTGHDAGYHTGMEASFVSGGFLEQGPAVAWLRMRFPLVQGESVSPLARVLIAGPIGYGLQSLLVGQRKAGG